MDHDAKVRLVLKSGKVLKTQKGTFYTPYRWGDLIRVSKAVVEEALRKDPYLKIGKC